jgi:hypothetical protein
MSNIRQSCNVKNMISLGLAGTTIDSDMQMNKRQSTRHAQDSKPNNAILLTYVWLGASMCADLHQSANTSPNCPQVMPDSPSPRSELEVGHERTNEFHCVQLKPASGVF